MVVSRQARERLKLGPGVFKTTGRRVVSRQARERLKLGPGVFRQQEMWSLAGRPGRD